MLFDSGATTMSDTAVEAARIQTVQELVFAWYDTHTQHNTTEAHADLVRRIDAHTEGAVKELEEMPEYANHTTSANIACHRKIDDLTTHLATIEGALTEIARITDDPDTGHDEFVKAWRVILRCIRARR